MRTIGLDLDGVVYQFSHAAQYMLAKREGLATREELPYIAGEYDHGWSRDDFDWLLADPQADAVFRHGHLFSGAIEFVADLASFAKVHVITKRPPAGVQATLDWLSFNKLPVSGVSIIALEDRKSDVPCDAYIDDAPSNIAELLDNTYLGQPLVLIDRPWNQDFNHAEVHRAFSFEDASGFLYRWSEGAKG